MGSTSASNPDAGHSSVVNASDGHTSALKYADVGINLGDPVYRGIYHGKAVHQNDLDGVISRAVDVGCCRFMITGSDLEESKHAISIAKDYPGICFATVGVHPCSCKQFDEYAQGPSAMLSEIKALAQSSIASGHTVAFGEIGLDYDRLYLTPKEQQLKYFEWQLDIAEEIQLPLFLHMRAACDDFERLLKPRLGRLPKKGLVHSFTGSAEELERMLAMGLDVGVNGCSLKTDENVEVVRTIPLERLQIETDGPWCEVRSSHASSQFLKGAPVLPKSVKKEKWAQGMLVKGRNEPVSIQLVAHAVAQIKAISTAQVCEAAWINSTKMFGLGEEPQSD